jgi:hypothetical protein
MSSPNFVNREGNRNESDAQKSCRNARDCQPDVDPGSAASGAASADDSHSSWSASSQSYPADPGLVLGPRREAADGRQKMSLPTEIIMPGDGAANPFTIPGTSRRYSCLAGSAITVPGEDAQMLRMHGWVGAKNARMRGEGPTSARPTFYDMLQGQTYNDATIGALVIFAGQKTGWLNSLTGAPA